MMATLADFYQGKRVLVTGHTGFLGGWTTACLKHFGAQVCGYGLPPTSRPNFFDATLLDRGMCSIFADLRDRNSLATAFAEFQPEIVIHCAARSHAKAPSSEPADAFSTNVMGAVHLLEEARLTASVRAMVAVNTVPQISSKPNIYAATMDCAELAISAFRSSLLDPARTAVATARVIEPIGGGDWREGHVIPTFLRALSNDGRVQIPEEQEFRVWHVLEPAHAILLLGQKLFEGGSEFARECELAPGRQCGCTVQDILAKFMELWDSEPAERASGDAIETLRWTVEWYRAFYVDSAAGWKITEDQIEQFVKLRSGSSAPHASTAALGNDSLPQLARR
jgi:CDP-glucose 4,6-dehydratase